MLFRFLLKILSAKISDTSYSQAIQITHIDGPVAELKEEHDSTYFYKVSYIDKNGRKSDIGLRNDSSTSRFVDELEKARENIKENGVEELVQVQRANATKLPFEDNSFDIVINEAMLTMLPIEAKEKAIREYLRVLKPNGLLLTHDVMLNTDDAEGVIAELRDAIHITVTPLKKEDWKELFHRCGFRNVDTYSGEMSLLSPKGLITDEGVLGAMKIISNALKPENRETFTKMFKTFNDPEKKMGFIAVCSQK